MSCDKDGTTVVQSSDPASPAASPPSDRAQLPVWPSTRPTWPSPCGLCSGRGLGEAGLLPGKRDGAYLQGGRRTVATNVMVRDLDQAAFAGADGRRLEVVVDGLPLFGGSQLAVDATLVSALHANGQARRAAQEDGAALITARRRKERRYPELVGPGARARLVVVGLEVGGRWSVETQIFLRLLARARARSEGYLMRR